MDIVGSPVVLLTGAGASAPLGLRTMGGFMELLHSRLEAEDKGDLWAFLANIHSYELHHPSPARRHAELDLERVLFTLEDYKELCARLTVEAMDENIKSFMLDSDLELADQLKERTTNLERFIKELILRHYSRIDSAKAYRLYTPLFDLIQQCTGVSHIPVFTTNYDAAIEEFVQIPEANVGLVDGFTRPRVGQRDWTGQFKLGESAGLQILLFKLHGSVYWIEPDPGKIYSVDGLSSADLGYLGRDMLIYPGLLKEIILEEPFRTLYKYFREYLRQAYVLVVLGYSFRDPGIELAIEVASESNPNLTLIILNRSLDTAAVERLSRLGLRQVIHVDHYIDFEGTYLPDLQKQLEVGLAQPLEQQYLNAAQMVFAAQIGPCARPVFLRQLARALQTDVMKASKALSYLIENGFVKVETARREAVIAATDALKDRPMKT